MAASLLASTLGEGAALADLGRLQEFDRAMPRGREALMEARGGADEARWIRHTGEVAGAGLNDDHLRELVPRDNRMHAAQESIEIGKPLVGRSTEMGVVHAIDWTDLMECRFILGDLAAAAEHTTKAVEVAHEVRSSLVKKAAP